MKLIERGKENVVVGGGPPPPRTFKSMGSARRRPRNMAMVLGVCWW
jgi:hypothetical protein